MGVSRQVGGNGAERAMTFPALVNEEYLALAAALVVLGVLCWALYPPAWDAQDEPVQPGPAPSPAHAASQFPRTPDGPAGGTGHRRTWLTGREIARIQTSHTSSIGRLSWSWVMMADGEVRYRLIDIDGRRERNAWQRVGRISASELRAVGTDRAKANDLLARVARERGHYPVQTHR